MHSIDLPPPNYFASSFYLSSLLTVENAASSCSIPCSSGSDDECLGDLQCFGNTQCMNRESFFCGSSWLDASDRCGTPCPTGDALECSNGEACFAWTSCANTESFYCGESFEDASSNCVNACPSRSSTDCPDGQGCFAYTTCQATNETGTHETDPLNVPMNDFFCGETSELASSTCAIACQSGDDSECPGEMKCHGGTGCSSRDSFWCGLDWKDAAEQCGQPCSTGSSDECPGDELCFAHTGCQRNLFFCGDTFEGASETCSEPCTSRSSEECTIPGQSCFAFVTDCASAGNPFSPSASPNSQTMDYSSNIANTQWNLEGAASAGNHKITNPDWYLKWENEIQSSSWMTRSASLALASIASISVVLSMLAL